MPRWSSGVSRSCGAADGDRDMTTLGGVRDMGLAVRRMNTHGRVSRCNSRLGPDSTHEHSPIAGCPVNGRCQSSRLEPRMAPGKVPLPEPNMPSDYASLLQPGRSPARSGTRNRIVMASDGVELRRGRRPLRRASRPTRRAPGRRRRPADDGRVRSPSRPAPPSRFQVGRLGDDFISGLAEVARRAHRHPVRALRCSCSMRADGDARPRGRAANLGALRYPSAPRRR